jgi:ribonuclease I
VYYPHASDVFANHNAQHPSPVVHGLWPECGSYGTSECLAPSSSSADPTTLYSCYNQAGESASSCLSFEQHEWEAHGVCAGVTNANDFFTQVIIYV